MEEQMRRMETAEMCFLRLVAGYRMRDDFRKGDIREELGITNVKTLIKYYQNKWLDRGSQNFKTWGRISPILPTRRPQVINEISLLEFEVLTATSMKMAVFCDVALCSLPACQCGILHNATSQKTSIFNLFISNKISEFTYTRDSVRLTPRFCGPQL
jgi:hypothetical protein